MLDLAILVLRLSMATVMIPHGLHKLGRLDFLDKKWLDQYGMPKGSAALSSVLEIVCGVAMLIGAFTSVAALVLFIVMLVGTWTSIWKEHEPYLSLPTGKGWDFNIFLVGALVAQILLGDGAWSVLRLFTGTP